MPLSRAIARQTLRSLDNSRTYALARGTLSQFSSTTVPENALAVKRAGRTRRRITVGETVAFGVVAEGRATVAEGSGEVVAVGAVVAVGGAAVGLGASVAIMVGIPVAAGTSPISGVLVARPGMLPFSPCKLLPSSRQPAMKPVRSTGTSHNKPRRPRRSVRPYWAVRLGPATVTAWDAPRSRAGGIRTTGIETVGAPAPAAATGSTLFATAGV